MRGRRQFREYLEEKEDKDWARRYILGPLTSPEPSQVDGPGTSFFNPRRSLSLNCRPTGKIPVANFPRRNSSSGPTPPNSSSPPRRPPVTIHHPKPISPGIRHSSLPPTEWASADIVLTRSRHNAPSNNNNTNSTTNTNGQPTRGRSTRRHITTATQYQQQQPASTTSQTQAHVRPSTANRPPTSSRAAAAVIQSQSAGIAAAATVEQRPSKRGRSRSLTSIIRIPSQSLNSFLGSGSNLASNLAAKIQSTNENFVRSKPTKPNPLFPQVKQPQLRRSTVQISDCYKNSQPAAIQSEYDRDREHEQSPLLSNKPSVDFTSRFPRVGVFPDSSPRSASTRTARSSRKPPQTHHTQRTADIVGEILADKTNAVNNRANILPPAANTAASYTVPTPLPVTPTTASPVSFRTAPMMAQQPPPPRSSASSFVGGSGGENMSIRSSKSKSPEKVHSRREHQHQSEQQQHQHRSSSSARHADRSDPKDKRPPSASRTSGSKSRHHRSSSRPLPDTIDGLDNTGVGPSYHHGGPYDATLASVNRYKKTAPLEAVKRSNHEALKATPKEYIIDSLRLHVPLQGTSSVPSGLTDMNGRVMKYEEGADLMREADAAGGAYKRYDFIKYHPDDLKGKGEPSFTLERSIKEDRARLGRNRASSYGVYELQDRSRKSQRQPLLTPEQASAASASSRRQSFNDYRRGDFNNGNREYQRLGSPSSARSSGSGSSRHKQATSHAEQTSFEPEDGSSNGGLRRGNSQRLSDGLKRRFGSLHRKQA